MKTHDAAGRHSRFANTVVGGEYRITERDLELLSLFQRYRYLPSHYVPALLGWQGDYYKDILGKHRRRTGALFVPENSWARGNGHARQAVYALTSAGEQILKEHGRYVHVLKSGEELPHELGVCLVRASFKLGAHENRLQLLGPADILSHPDCNPQVRRSGDPFTLNATFDYVIPRGPRKGDVELITKDVKTDGEFMVLARPHERGRTSIAIPGIEFDRNTEDLEPQDYERVFIAGKILAQRQLVREGIYLKRYGFRSLIVPFVTISLARMHGMMRLVERLTHGHGSSLFIFKTLPDFSTFEKFPPPDGHILRGWLRVGKGGVSEPYDFLSELGVV